MWITHEEHKRWGNGSEIITCNQIKPNEIYEETFESKLLYRLLKIYKSILLSQFE